MSDTQNRSITTTSDESLKEDVAKLEAMLSPDLKYEMVTMETADQTDRSRITELMNEILKIPTAFCSTAATPRSSSLQSVTICWKEYAIRM